MDKIALICAFVIEYFQPLSMLKVIFKASYIPTQIRMNISSSTLSFIINHFSLIEIAIFK